MEAKIIPFPLDRVKSPELSTSIDFEYAWNTYIEKNHADNIDILIQANAFAERFGEIKDFVASEIAHEIIKGTRALSFIEPQESLANEDKLAYELAKEWGDRERAVAVLARTVEVRGANEELKLIEFTGTLAHMTFDDAYANWHETLNENIANDGLNLGFREPYLFLFDGNIDKNGKKITGNSVPVMVPLSRIELICYLSK